MAMSLKVVAIHFDSRSDGLRRNAAGRTLCVRFPMLGAYLDAERQGPHSHAERGNEQKGCGWIGARK